MALGTALLPFIPDCSESTVRYIAPSGNDSSGDGSIGNPWKSPGKAFADIPLAGSVVLARGGAYGSLGQQRWSRIASASDPVQLRAYPGETPTFNGVTSWRLTGRFLRLGPGLNINPAANSGDNNIMWILGALDCEIVGNVITNSTSGVQPASNQGILINAGRMNIYNNDFIGNGAGQNQTHCIYFSSCNAQSVIANNIFRDGSAGYGIQLYPNADGVIVVCNVFDGFTNRAAIVLGGDPGAATNNAIILGNITRQAANGRQSIYVNWEGPTGSGQVSDNIGHLNPGGDFDNPSPGVSFFNNLENTDPMFDNPGGNDFHISNDASPAKGRVPAVREGYVPALDKDGNARTSADAGAYKVGTGGPPPPNPQPPANVTAPVISGVAEDGETLTASTGTWSNSPTSFAYQWQRCNASGGSCTNIGAATTNTYVLTGADLESTVRVRVTATNADGSTIAYSAPTAVIGGPVGGGGSPTSLTAPSISGITQNGSTLTAGPGTWSGDTPMSMGYQWQRCDTGGGSCVDIAGASGPSYIQVGADVASTIKVRVTANNPSGSASATSAATAVVMESIGGGTATIIEDGTARFQLDGSFLETNIKSSKGKVRGWACYNTLGVLPYHVHLYNDSGPPDVGSDTPVTSISVSPEAGSNFGNIAINQFPDGIAVGVSINEDGTGTPEAPGVFTIYFS